MEIDEARSYDQTVGVNHLGRVAAVEFADLGDLAVLDADIAWAS
jgi:hypothetical protein